MAKPSVNGYKYLECRYLRHAWLEIEINPEDAPERPYYVPANSVYERVHCARCGCFRGRWLDNQGERYKTHYSYPDDYRFEYKEGQDTLKHVDFRVAMFKRVKVRRR